MAKKNFILHDEEKLEKILTNIQKHWFWKDTRDGYRICLLVEEQDWAVVLTWLIDNNVIKAPKQRPPIAKFIKWLQQHPDWKYIPSCKELSRILLAWDKQPHYYRTKLLYDTISKLFFGEPESISRQPEPISRQEEDFETLLTLLRTPKLS